MWGARLAWLAVAVFGGEAIGDALSSRSEPVQLVGTIGAWLAWAVGALALAVPSLVTLTVVRAVVPGAVVAAGVALAAGAELGSVLTLAVPAVVSSVLVGAADTGRAFVQTSAYGDEQRFPLRPPLGYLGATVVSWSLWVAAVITAPLAWAARAWALAVIATLASAAATWLLPRRWHQLSRRWLVTVPAGLVVHDPVVLAEPLMMQRRGIAELGLVDSRRASGAFDLTGPTPGLAVAVTLAEGATATLAPRPRTPRGRAIHMTALLVSPSRPGAMLREAARRGLPVR
jgi:hypothetical protein